MRIISARYLGASSYGLFALGITIVNIITIFSLLGLPRGIARQMPRSDKNQELIIAALIVSAPVTLLLTVFLAWSSPTLSHILETENLHSILLILSFSIPFLVVAKIGIGVSRGIEDITGQLLIENLSNQFIKLALIVIAISFGAHTFGVTIGWFVASLIAGIVSVLYIFRSIRFYRDIDYISIQRHIKTLFLFSLPLLVAESLWRLMKQVDNFLLAYYQTSDIVGIYDASFLLARGIFFVPMSVTFLFLPMFSKLHEEGDSKAMVSFYRLATKWTVFIVLPLLAIFIFFPADIIKSVYGSSYVSGSPVLIILLIGYFIHILMGFNIEGLTSIGETKLIMYGNVLGFSINLLSNIVLIPRYSMTGAALSSLATFIVINSFYAYLLREKANIHPFYKGLFKPLALVVLVLVPLYIVRQIIDFSYVGKVGLGAVVFGITTLIMIKESRSLLGKLSEFTDL